MPKATFISWHHQKTKIRTAQSRSWLPGIHDPPRGKRQKEKKKKMQENASENVKLLPFAEFRGMKGRKRHGFVECNVCCYADACRTGKARAHQELSCSAQWVVK
jgi:hypothetical protein